MFHSKPRPDKSAVYSAGFRQALDHRLDEIEVLAAGDALVTRYLLSYEQDPQNNRSHLVAVQRVGSDDNSTLPPWTFEYTSFDRGGTVVPGFEDTMDTGFSSGAAPEDFVRVSLVDSPNVVNALVDMNADGLVDAYDHGEVLLNRGDALLSPGQPWEPFLSDFGYAGSGQTWWVSTAVADVNGDLFPDRLVTDALGNETVQLGTGTGIGSSTIALADRVSAPGSQAGSSELAVVDQGGSPGYSSVRDPYWYIAAAEDGRVSSALHDLTGDGLPDRILTEGGLPGYCFAYGDIGTHYDSTDPNDFDADWAAYDSGWAVLPNRGISTSGTSIEFGDPVGWGNPLYPSPASLLVYGHVSTGGLVSKFLVDVNADGLDDLMTSDFSFLPNTGAAFDAEQPAVGTYPTPLPPLQLSRAVSGSGASASGFSDLNGDGFPDHIEADRTGWSVTWGTSAGIDFDQQSTFAVPNEPRFNFLAFANTGSGAAESGALVDMDGDRLPDAVHGFAQEVRLNRGIVPGLLKLATTPTGGTTEWEWSFSTQQKDSLGNPANPGVPSVLPVVAETRVGDGRTGTEKIVAQYTWADGNYGKAEREFFGFGSVTATMFDAAATTGRRVRSYRTDSTCPGALLEATIEDAAGSVLTRSQRSYLEETGGSDPSQTWARCLPATLVAESVEGNEAAKRESRVEYDYGTPVDSHGNVRWVRELGDPALVGDEAKTHLQYAAPQGDSHVVSAVSERTVTALDDDDLIYSRERRYYDHLPLGQVSGGLLTRIERLRASSPAGPGDDNWVVVADIQYDAFGNPTLLVGPPTADDPSGYAEAIEYDSTYGTYVVATVAAADLGTKALRTEITHGTCALSAPPPGLGRPCSTRDPRGQTTQHGYDVFGRRTRSEFPQGAIETLTYALPGAGAEAVTTVAREVQASGQLLEYETLLDGLGRAYRREAPGAAGEQVVMERTYNGQGQVATRTAPHFAGAPPLLSQTEYDALGRPTEHLGIDGDTRTTWVYDPWQISIETYFGTAVAANRQRRIEHIRDGLGRPTRRTEYVDPVGLSEARTIETQYNPAGLPVAVLDAIGVDPGLCAPGDPCENQRHRTDVSWDTLGLREALDHADSGLWSFTHDDAGLLKSRTDAAGRVQSANYDELRRLVTRDFSPSADGVAGAVYAYEQDETQADFGLLQSITSASGASFSYLREYAYDVYGRQIQESLEIDSKRFETEYGYDELDRLRRRVFPDGEAFDYSYSGVRLASIEGDPANDVWPKAVLQNALWDARGRPEALGLGEGTQGAALAQMTYAFDPSTARLSRITGVHANLGTRDTDYDGTADSSDLCPFYGESDPVADMDSSGIGDECECGDANMSGSVNIFDVFAATDIILGSPETPLCDTNEDASCNIIDINGINDKILGIPAYCERYPSTQIPGDDILDMVPSFDGLGRLTTMQGSFFGAAQNRSYQYDGLGHLTQATGPWESGHGTSGDVTWTFSYDPLGNLTTQTSDASGGGYSRTWDYEDPSLPRFLTQFTETVPGGSPTSDPTSSDPVGNPTSLDGMPLVWNAQQRLHYDGVFSHAYDSDARIIKTTAAGEDPTELIRPTGDFAYDALTAIATKSFSIGTVPIATLATTYTPPVAAEAPGGWSFPIEDVPESIWILLMSLALASALSLRARPVVGVRRASAAAGIASLSFSVVLLPSAAWAAADPGEGPLPHRGHKDAFMALMADHLGNVRAMVDVRGLVVSTRDYTPYGMELDPEGVFDPRYGWNGADNAYSTDNLVHLGARFYAPKRGRFLSPDEAIEGLTPTGLNSYAYVRNQPTSRIDPTGTLSAGPSTIMISVFGFELTIINDGGGPSGPGRLTRGRNRSRDAALDKWAAEVGAAKGGRKGGQNLPLPSPPDGDSDGDGDSPSGGGDLNTEIPQTDNTADSPSNTTRSVPTNGDKPIDEIVVRGSRVGYVAASAFLTVAFLPVEVPVLVAAGIVTGVILLAWGGSELYDIVTQDDGAGDGVEADGQGDLEGENPRDDGNRTNTDLPGGRQAAEEKFSELTKGQRTTKHPMANGGQREQAPDGTQIRRNPDGTTRIDVPGRGPHGSETIHYD